MDESWRIPIGSVVPRRRSTEQPRRPAGDLDPGDFHDVFGGPPRSLLLRQFSGGDLTFPSSSASSRFDRLQCYHQQPGSRRQPSFYEEVFRQQPQDETGPHTETKCGRSLPDFTIPSTVRRGERRNGRAGGGSAWGVRTDDGFYDDIFGSEWRSRTRSRQSTSKTKSNASSALSSEERELVNPPLRPYVADDGVLTSFVSKLRPITIPSRRGSSPSPTLPSGEEHISSHQTSTVPCPRSCLMNFRFDDVVTGPKAVHPCQLFRPYTPPETAIGIEPKRPAADDGSDGDSPSSAVSSIYDIPMATIRPVGPHEKAGPLDFEEVVLEDDEEADNEYMIEIVPGREGAETGGSAAVDEAIAWVKEKSRASWTDGIGVGEDQKQNSNIEAYEQMKCREGLIGRKGLQDGAYHLEILRAGCPDVSALEVSMLFTK